MFLFRFLYRHEHSYLFLLASINVFVKGIYLGEVSITGDESATLDICHSTEGDILALSTEGINPPLYFLLAKWWSMIFGISEMSLRSLSLIFSTATLWPLFYISKNHFNRLTGFFATALYSISGVHLLYSHDARCYSMVFFLASVSFLVFMNLLKTPSRKNAFFLFLINTLLFYTHFTAIFIPIGQFLALLIGYKKYRKSLKLFFISQLFVFLSITHWIYILLKPYFSNTNNYDVTRFNFWVQKPVWDDVTNYIDSIAVDHHLLKMYGLLVAITLGLIIVFYRKRFWKKDIYLLSDLICFSFVIIAIIYLFSSVTSSVFIPRYILYTSFPLYVLVGFVMSRIPFIQGVKLFLILYFVLQSGKLLNLNPYKGEDWKIVASDLRVLMQDSDVVMVKPAYQLYCFGYYIARYQYDNDYSHFREFMASKRLYLVNDVSSWAYMDTAYAKRFIYVNSHFAIGDPNHSIEAKLNQWGKEKRMIDYGGIRTYIYEKKQNVTSDSVTIH